MCTPSNENEAKSFPGFPWMWPSRAEFQNKKEKQGEEEPSWSELSSVQRFCCFSSGMKYIYFELYGTLTFSKKFKNIFIFDGASIISQLWIFPFLEYSATLLSIYYYCYYRSSQKFSICKTFTDPQDHNIHELDTLSPRCSQRDLFVRALRETLRSVRVILGTELPKWIDWVFISTEQYNFPEFKDCS